jgi:hypothetical protein
MSLGSKIRSWARVNQHVLSAQAVTELQSLVGDWNKPERIVYRADCPSCRAGFESDEPIQNVFCPSCIDMGQAICGVLHGIATEAHCDVDDETD